MNFDYTYITLLGYTIFEPLVILTNLIFFIIAAFGFFKLKNFRDAYSRYMSLFLFLLGISTLLGAIDHGVHYQLGTKFFNVVLFLMNATSLVAMYYCFLGPYIYYHRAKGPGQRVNVFLLLWMLIVLICCSLLQNFVIIKIHAGIVLTYSLVVHWIIYKRNKHAGSRWVVVGILTSFLPIIVHSLKWSLGEWCNHKDIAHVLMIVSLSILFKGVYTNSKDIAAGKIAL